MRLAMAGIVASLRDAGRGGDSVMRYSAAAMHRCARMPPPPRVPPVRARSGGGAPASSAAMIPRSARPRAERVDDLAGTAGCSKNGAVREHRAPSLPRPTTAERAPRRTASRARSAASAAPEPGADRKATSSAGARVWNRSVRGGWYTSYESRTPAAATDCSASTISPGPVACTQDRVFRNSTASSDGRNVALTPSTSESKTRSPSGVTVIVVRPVRPGATATWRMSIPRPRPCARTNRPSSSSPTAPT